MPPLKTGFGPRINGALFETHSLIGDDKLFVDQKVISKSITVSAGSIGIVKREKRREKFWKLQITLATAKINGKFISFYCSLNLILLVFLF